jgi:hypothetical protein
MKLKIALSLLVGWVCIAGWTQARTSSTDVRVKVAKSSEVLAKAGQYAEIYKDHNRKYWRAIVGMIPLYLDGKKTPVEGYCVNIGVPSGDFSATSMTLKSADSSDVEPTSPTTASAGSGRVATRVAGMTRPGLEAQAPVANLLPELMAAEDVDRVAYILNSYPLTDLGTSAAKLRGTALQTAVWRLLYGDTPLYTVYPNSTPVMADMPVHDNDPQRTDTEIEDLAQEMLDASQGKRLLEAEDGSLTVQLQLDPTLNRVHVFVSAQQGDQFAVGQPFHLTTSNGTFAEGGSVLDAVTDTSGTYVTYVDNPTPTAKAVAYKGLKGAKRSKRGTKTETRTVTVTATATGRTVYLLLSANSAKQDVIFAASGNYCQTQTLQWNTTIATKGSIEQLPFWQHHVWYHAANNIPNPVVGKAEIMSFLPFQDIEGNQIDTFEKLYDILKGSLATGNAYHRARANQYYTALMLNIAYAPIASDAMVDTNADKVPDMRLSDALVQIHALYDGGSWSAAKNICKSINAM